MSRRSRVHWRHESGAVDVSIQTLFGMMLALGAMLLVVEASAYWHARNVFAEAAAEGARVAAAYDGSCQKGVAAARAMVSTHASGWASGLEVRCQRGQMVSVTVTARTPGVWAGSLGFRARASEEVPREG